MADGQPSQTDKGRETTGLVMVCHGLRDEIPCPTNCQLSQLSLCFLSQNNTARDMEFPSHSQQQEGKSNSWKSSIAGSSAVRSRVDSTGVGAGACAVALAVHQFWRTPKLGRFDSKVFQCHPLCIERDHPEITVGGGPFSSDFTLSLLISQQLILLESSRPIIAGPMAAFLLVK